MKNTERRPPRLIIGAVALVALGFLMVAFYFGFGQGGIGTSSITKGETGSLVTGNAVAEKLSEQQVGMAAVLIGGFVVLALLFLPGIKPKTPLREAFDEARHK